MYVIYSKSSKLIALLYNFFLYSPAVSLLKSKLIVLNFAIKQLSTGFQLPLYLDVFGNSDTVRLWKYNSFNGLKTHPLAGFTLLFLQVLPTFFHGFQRDTVYDQIYMKSNLQTVNWYLLCLVKLKSSAFGIDAKWWKSSDGFKNDCWKVRPINFCFCNALKDTTNSIDQLKKYQVQRL